MHILHYQFSLFPYYYSPLVVVAIITIHLLVLVLILVAEVFIVLIRLLWGRLLRPWGTIQGPGPAKHLQHARCLPMRPHIVIAIVSLSRVLFYLSS